MDFSLTPQEEEEMLEMFSFEAQEMHQHLNELLTAFESDPENGENIDEIFRIVHTLKGSAMGMDFEGISALTHVMEDLFEEIKNGNIEINKSLFNALFKACDKLGELIGQIKSKDSAKVSYKGVRTKLQVILRKAKEKTTEEVEGAEAQNQEVVATTSFENESIPVSEEAYHQNPVIEEAEGNELLLDKEGASSMLERCTGWVKSWIIKLKRDKDEKESKTSSSKEQNHEGEKFSVSTSIENIDNGIQESSQEGLGEETVETLHSDLEGEDCVNVEETDQEDLLKNIEEKVAITDLVQVPIRKLDNLMNQVGQLIIERDRLMAINSVNGSRNTEFASLQRITSDLQYSVMDVRLVQIGSLFNKFHRIARDVSAIENKDVQLKVKGTEVEIDRNILKTISESMVHLVRNAVGHGVESRQDRLSSGKSEIATITLSARAEKDNVVIEVQDDGQGIDAQAIRNKIVAKGLVQQEYADHLTDDEVIMFIFEPGFSNADEISEISGRGVGMDVVKNSIESIGGHIYLDTKVGVGTTISLNLPSSMAVKGVLLFQMRDQEFAFALSYTEAVISLYKRNIHRAGIGLMSSYLKHTISVIFFSDLFDMRDFSEIYEGDSLTRTYDQLEDDEKLDVIVVSYGDKYIGVVVDKLLQQKEIIEKTIPKPLDNNKLLSGTTILGNGNVCLVVDVAAVAAILYKSKLQIHETKKVS
ncbi:chemotaxis protein CheA [Reichenbachiella sp.]|uniref:chemotaxis protein CheA n=1 Tax=Reichenbachiella sp. TaxID=2184521 RepID=UPI003BAE3F36